MWDICRYLFAPSYKQYVNKKQEKMVEPVFSNDMQSLMLSGKCRDVSGVIVC